MALPFAVGRAKLVDLSISEVERQSFGATAGSYFDFKGEDQQQLLRIHLLPFSEPQQVDGEV